MGEPEDAKIISTQKGLSSCHAPGWNDPPKSISNAKENSSTTPTKRLLNKRVAFPLNSTVNTSNLPSQSPVSIPPNLPPPLPSQGKTNNSSVTEASKGNEEESSGPFIHKEDSLNETLANLEVVIEKHVQSETKSQEVKKRIETMKTLWLNDKLDDNIHRKVLDLSEALMKEDIEKADKIHISLMMERASLCTSWISGIRHLILEMKSKIIKNDTDTNSESSTSSISTLSLE